MIKSLFLFVVGIFSTTTFLQAQLVFEDSIPNAQGIIANPVTYGGKIKISSSRVHPHLFYVGFIKDDGKNLELRIYNIDSIGQSKVKVETIRTGISESNFRANNVYGLRHFWEDGNRIFFDYSKYLTVATLNSTGDTIESVVHLNAVDSLGGAYEFITSNQESLYFALPVQGFDKANYLNNIPKLQQASIQALHPQQLDTVGCQGFESMFWNFAEFMPMGLIQDRIFALNPLQHTLYLFNPIEKSWQAKSISNLPFEPNNRPCLDSVLKANPGKEYTLYSQCSPRNFYYKSLGSFGNELYMLRSYFSEDSGHVYLDAFHVSDEGDCSFLYSTRIDTIPEKDWYGNHVPWNRALILTGSMCANREYFARITIGTSDEFFYGDNGEKDKFRIEFYRLSH